MMFTQRDSRNDKRQTVGAQILGVAVHPVDSSGSIQAFGGRNQRKAKAEANASPL